MKMKEFGPRGGVRVPGAPLRSATGYHYIGVTLTHSVIRGRMYVSHRAQPSVGWCAANAPYRIRQSE